MRTDLNPEGPPLPASIPGFQEGIFFGMDEAVYHAIPALSASGIRLLRISPLEFWMQSIMNPERDLIEEETDSFAKTLGSAYHSRICEGKAVFDSRFAPKIDPRDYKDVLETADDLKSVIKSHNEIVGKDGKINVTGSKPELIERVLTINPAAKIWDVICESYYGEHKGKQFLPWKYIRRIETAAKMIEADPQLGRAFTGGASEVSVCWICPTHRIPMKIRVDYLKAKSLVELKSYSNPNGRQIDRAITSAFAGRRYHIAAALYDEGVNMIADLIKAGNVFGEHDPALIRALEAGHEKTYLMVFQHSGFAPIVRGKILPKESMFFQAGQTEVDAGKMLYRTCMEKFGPNVPWIDAAPIESFDDANIPSYGLE